MAGKDFVYVVRAILLDEEALSSNWFLSIHMNLVQFITQLNKLQLKKGKLFEKSV
jgi:hypothetical protein